MHSGRILDLKDRKASGIDYFFESMVPIIKSPEMLIVVPSHDPAKVTSGVHDLVTKLATHLGIADGGTCLRRTEKIGKLAAGGDRSIEVHLGSIVADMAGAIKDRAVLIVDDVTTTGNSLLACRRIIHQAGAREVKCVALGKTTY